MRVTIHHNPETGAVWAQHGSYDPMFLRRATDASDAYTSVGEASIVRTSNWVPAYGPVLQCQGYIGEDK
jgi:hypothetical protein